MCNRKLLLCFVSLTILLTTNASSYGPCSNAKDCKASMTHEFSFTYVQAQNRFTEQKLNILMNAGQDLMYTAFTDPKKRETLTEVLEAIQKDIQALSQPRLLDLKTSKAAIENAEKLWKTIFDICGEMDNLRYYEKLIDRKIEFLNDILGNWKGSKGLMRIKSEEDDKEIDDINKDVKAIGEISSLLGKEEKMKKLIERIFKYLEIEN